MTNADSAKEQTSAEGTNATQKKLCPHENVEWYNHGYHNVCKDCGKSDV